MIHSDVLQVDYPTLQSSLSPNSPLAVIGNLPYYITSQILFALADASHSTAVRTATVTMQLEVGQRLVASTSTKAYGILSVAFQIYADTRLHFKIPNTVFYPKPKVESCLVGMGFVGEVELRRRLDGVRPSDLRRVVQMSFQQRRKTLRSSLRRILMEVHNGDKIKVNDIVKGGRKVEVPAGVKARAEGGDEFAIQQELPEEWGSMRPEELKPMQFIELTRLIYGEEEDKENYELGVKVWRKLKHGKG